MWGLAGKGVVWADSLARAEGAASVVGRVVNASFPSVWMSTWAFCASPVSPKTALRLDDSVAKVSIAGMVPQALQARAEEADVGANWWSGWCFSCLNIHSPWFACRRPSCKRYKAKLTMVYSSKQYYICSLQSVIVQEAGHSGRAISASVHHTESTAAANTVVTAT